MKVKIYQTLQDRNNSQEVNENGPFECFDVDAWLGVGIYFWETYFEHAQWWGVAKVKNPYIICEAFLELNEDCWDLYNNPDHRREFEMAKEELLANKLFDKNKIIVPNVITFMKEIGIFEYKVIRAATPNVVGKRQIKKTSSTIPFRKYGEHVENHNRSELDLKPIVQICVLNRKAVPLQDFRVIYPIKLNLC